MLSVIKFNQECQDLFNQGALEKTHRLHNDLAQLVSNQAFAIAENKLRREYGNWDSDSIAQNATLVFLAKASNTGKSYNTFLETIIRRKIIDELRSMKRRPTMHFSDLDNTYAIDNFAPDPHGAWIDDEDRTYRIQQIYKRLSEKSKQVMQDVIDGRPYNDVSERDGIPLGTVKSRLGSARADARAVASKYGKTLRPHEADCVKEAIGVHATRHVTPIETSRTSDKGRG